MISVVGYSWHYDWQRPHVWVLVAIHVRAVRAGTGFNDLMTTFKVAGIVAILLAAAAVGRGDVSNLVTESYVPMVVLTMLASWGSHLM